MRRTKKSTGSRIRPRSCRTLRGTDSDKIWEKFKSKIDEVQGYLHEIYEALSSYNRDYVRKYMVSCNFKELIYGHGLKIRFTLNERDWEYVEFEFPADKPKEYKMSMNGIRNACPQNQVKFLASVCQATEIFDEYIGNIKASYKVVPEIFKLRFSNGIDKETIEEMDEFINHSMGWDY